MAILNLLENLCWVFIELCLSLLTFKTPGPYMYQVGSAFLFQDRIGEGDLLRLGAFSFFLLLFFSGLSAK